MAATDLERLVVSLDADIKKFERELKRANNIADGQFRDIERRGTRATKNLSNSFGGLSGIAKNAFAGFAAGALSALAPVALLTAAIQGTRKALAEFGKLADDIKPTGLNPEIYQALGLAAREAGVGVDELNAAFLIFAKNVGLAQSGTGPLLSGLKKLNPELLKNILAAKDQDTRLRLVAEAMKQAGSATRQAALASVAFGRGGVKIVEALKGGSAAIDEFIRKGKEMGVLLTASELAEADELSDKIDVLAFAIDTNLNKALINMAPLLVEGAESFAKFTKALSDLGNQETNFENLVRLLGTNLFIIDPTGNAKAALLDLAKGADTLVDKLSTGSETVRALSGDIRQAFADIPRDMITPEQIASLDALVAKLGENGEGADEVKRKLQELAQSNPEFIALAERLTPLLDKLIAIQAAAGGATSALANLEGNRAGGFAFQSQRESENAAARDFFAARQADAGRTSAQRELDAKAEEVLNKAKEEGIELTEAAARAEAELELAREKSVKEAEKGRSGNDALKESNDLREQQHQLIRDTIVGIQEETAAIGFETQHINETNAVRERARVVFETLNRLQAQGVTITNELRAAVEREADARFQQISTYDAAAAAADELARAQEDLAAQQAEINDAFRDSMKGFISDLAHGKSLTDALTNALGRLGDRLLDLALDNLFGKSGSTGFGLLGELFGISTKAASTFKPDTTIAQYLASVAGGGGTSGGNNFSAPMSLAGIGSPNELARYAAAIRTIESGSAAGNYSALGPLTRTGDRAYGAYQVMGANIGPWSEKWTGQRMNASQFLGSRAAQDQIFAGEFGSYVDKFGPSRAANTWFTGSPMGGGRDVLGTSSIDYVAKFNEALKGTPAALDQITTASTGAADALTQSISDVTGDLGKFGSSLSSFLSSTTGGGSSWFKNLAGLFGGTGGALNYMNSISPLATMSILSGAGGLFAEGGYTGDIGTKTPAGIVHGGEFVMNAAATSRNRGLLEALNNGLPGYAAGGFVLPRLRRAAAGGNLGRKGTTNVAITVVTPDAPSFMRSQNQIAAKTAATVDRAFRTQ